MNPLLVSVTLACLGQFGPCDDFGCRGPMPMHPPRAIISPFNEPCEEEDCPFGHCSPRYRSQGLSPLADEDFIPARPRNGFGTRGRVVQRVCPVTGERLDVMGSPIPVHVLGRSFLVCCEECAEIVERNPRLYLSRVVRELAPSMPNVHPAPKAPNAGTVPSVRPAAPKPTAAPNIPSTASKKWGGQQTCPVTGEDLGSMGPPIPVSIRGRTVWVCCKSCVAALQKNPDKYLVPRPDQNHQRNRDDAPVHGPNHTHHSGVSDS